MIRPMFSFARSAALLGLAVAALLHATPVRAQAADTTAISTALWTACPGAVVRVATRSGGVVQGDERDGNPPALMDIEKTDLGGGDRKVLAQLVLQAAHDHAFVLRPRNSASPSPKTGSSNDPVDGDLAVADHGTAGTH